MSSLVNNLEQIGKTPIKHTSLCPIVVFPNATARPPVATAGPNCPESEEIDEASRQAADRRRDDPPGSPGPPRRRRRTRKPTPRPAVGRDELRQARREGAGLDRAGPGGTPAHPRSHGAD